ncbi:hypothetical protein FG05_35321 [Fusarium graminearum]|nr:hypothetical protein FG05_35321 [Fusarium graminearum]
MTPYQTDSSTGNRIEIGSTYLAVRQSTG